MSTTTALWKARSSRVLLSTFIDLSDEIVALDLPGSTGDVARLMADDAARLLGRLDGLLLRLEDAERKATEPEPRPAA